MKLVEALGPAGIVNALATFASSRQEHDACAESLELVLGSATRSKDPTLREAYAGEVLAYLKDATNRWNGSAGMSSVLKNASCSTAFTEVVVEGLVDYEITSTYTFEFTGNLMEMLSHNPEAAIDFFGSGATQLVEVPGQSSVAVNGRAHWLFSRGWTGKDDAEQAGAALEAATTMLRDHDRDAQSRSWGYKSAQTATQALLLAGSAAEDVAHAGLYIPAGLQRSVAIIVANYMPDFFRVAGKSLPLSDSIDGSFVFDDRGEYLPSGFPWGAQIHVDVMRNLLRLLGEDPSTLDVVGASWAGAASFYLNYHIAGDGPGAMTNPFQMADWLNIGAGSTSSFGRTCVHVLEFVMGSASAGDVTLGQAEVWQKQWNNLVDMAAGGPPPGTLSGAGWAGFMESLSKASSSLAEDDRAQAGGENMSGDGSAAVKEGLEQLRVAAKYEFLNALLAGGVFGQAALGAYEKIPYVAPIRDPRSWDPPIIKTLTDGQEVFEFGQAFDDWARQSGVMIKADRAVGI